MTKARPDHLFAALLSGALAFAGAVPASADLTDGGEVAVRILWDNSASMYPGYQPPGTPGNRGKVKGVHFYHEYPWMRGWLQDFVIRQSILDAGSVDFSIFTCDASNAPGVIDTTHGRSSLADFNAGKALGYDKVAGRQTYIAANLRKHTQGFEGLIWLITDNIVEEKAGKPDEGVKEFFKMLAGEPRYRSVHLYKLPFTDPQSGVSGNLAVYGILVADKDPGEGVLRYFDNKFRSVFLEAERKSGGLLFPEKAYWKLKDIDVGALELSVRPVLEVRIEQKDKVFFTERQKIHLSLRGSVSSRLTQHRVVSGTYIVQPITTFQPSVLYPKSAKGEDLGLPPLGTSDFQSTRKSLPTIEPRGEMPIDETFTSTKPIPLQTDGFRGWWLSAWAGLNVSYKGDVVAVFDNVEIEFVKDRMSGIFGADAAPEIFQIPERRTIGGTVSSPAPVSFQLQSSYTRTLLLAVVAFLAAVPIGLIFFVLRRKVSFRVKIGDQSDLVLVRPMIGSEGITYEGYLLGTLSCNFQGRGEFAPNNTSAAVQVRPTTQSGSWDVTLRDRGARLTIESQAGQQVVTRGGGEGRSDRLRPGAPIAVPGATGVSERRAAAPPPLGSAAPLPSGSAAPQPSGSAAPPPPGGGIATAAAGKEGGKRPVISSPGGKRPSIKPPRS